MTYIGLLAIIATIWAVVGSLYSLIRYLRLKRKFPSSYAAYFERSNIVFRIFIPFLNIAIFWLFSLLIIGLIFRNTPTIVYTKTTVNSNEQVVVFESQDNDKYIVSIDGKKYVCTHIVIDDELQNVQVKFVDSEIADNFIANFFAYEFVECKDTYELHIPASFFNSST